jgi:hypothetical protein
MEIPKAEFEAFIKAGRDLLTAIAPLCGEDYKAEDRETNVTMRQAGQVGRAVLGVINSMHIEAESFPLPPTRPFIPPPAQ